MEKNRPLFVKMIDDGATWKLVEGSHKGHFFVKFTVPGEDGGVYTYAASDRGMLTYNFL